MVRLDVGMPGVSPELASPSDRFMRDWDNSANPVQLKMIYVRYICDVDLRSQTFRAAIGFDMSWPSSDADVSSWNKSPATFVPEYVPNFEFPAAKDSTEERRAQENGNAFKIDEVDVDGEVVPHNFLRTLVYVTCIERYELGNLPFDTQELNVVMDMSFAGVEKAMFVPPKESVASRTEGDVSTAPFLILNREYCAVPEYRVRRAVAEFTSRSYGSDAELDDKAFRWAQVTLRFQLERRSEGYVARIAFLCFLLSVSSLAAFMMDPVDDLPDRLGFLMTLVLASVAFQYVVSSELPQMPYLCLLEKYTLTIFASTVGLLAMVAIIGGNLFISDDSVRGDVDTYLAIGFVGWLVSLQVFFVVYGGRARKKELDKLNMGSLALADANYEASEDTPVMVTGAGGLPESERTKWKKAQNAFVSFAGIDK